MALPTEQEWMAQQLRTTAEGLAATLEDLAARVRQQAADLDQPTDRVAYASRAGRIVSDIHNGLANLNVSGLIQAAANADVSADRAKRPPQGE